MNATSETELDRATRQVAECEARCARQRARIAQMTAAGQDTTEAKTLLVEFDDFLRLSREHQQHLLDEDQN